MIRLLCGYKRTGKDTLDKMFTGKENFRWIVYNNPESEKCFVIENVDRIGIADKLREEVNTILNIADSIDYNTFKNTVIQEGKTYRDILIDHAAYRRGQNLDYWVARASDWDSLNKDDRIMITDWRYPNELSYLQSYSNLEVVTIRLFRSVVSIPPNDVISEHHLDNIITDFLLVPIENHEAEFHLACNLFPQYQNYVRTNVCTSDCCV